MKTLFAFVLFGILSASAFAEITPEQARADIQSLIKRSIKGEVVEPNHRYNTTLSFDNRDSLSITLATPLYSVSHGIVSEQGVSWSKSFSVDKDTYMIRKTEGTEGPLTVVTYRVRNRVRDPEAPSRVSVSRETLKVFVRSSTRAIVRVVLEVPQKYSVIENETLTFVPKQWEHPTRL